MAFNVAIFSIFDKIAMLNAIFRVFIHPFVMDAWLSSVYVTCEFSSSSADAFGGAAVVVHDDVGRSLFFSPYGAVCLCSAAIMTFEGGGGA